MTGHPRPGLATRLAAVFHGEVGAATVEAYRRAGAAAYNDQAEAERVCSELVLSGHSIWTAAPHEASQFLCTWNAFALQTLGDELVEADYRADPRTVGYLPRVTAEQAARFLSEVEHWSSRARRAACDETYDVEPGFDPWCLTDPVNRRLWQYDPAARQAIDLLWQYDPDPAATRYIQAEIDAAVAGGRLVIAGTIRSTANYFFRCPWSAIYLVYRPVVIAGQSLTPIQQFAFEVSAEPMLEGKEFVRHLVTGPFHASSQVDYGDRASGE